MFQHRVLTLTLCGFLLAGVVGTWHLQEGRSMADESPKPYLAHMVYFTLKDKTPENRDKLIAACRKYLPGHAGIVFFAVGTLAGELQREVNDRDFDVALHVVFSSLKHHDDYQVSAMHTQFVNDNKHLWSKVRVFDSHAR